MRFRVNTLVNYEVVDRAFAAFEEDLRGTPDYVRATAWWVKVEKKVRQDIKRLRSISCIADMHIYHILYYITFYYIILYYVISYSILFYSILLSCIMLYIHHT